MMNKKGVIIGLALVILVVAGSYFYDKYFSPVDLLDEIEDIRNSPSGKANTALQNHYAYLDTIEILTSSGAFKDAVDYLDTLIEKETDYEPIYHLEKGKLLFSLGDFTAAIKSFSSSISVSPYGSKTALEWRAYSYLNLQDCESAMRDAQSLIAEDSSHWNQYQSIKISCDSVSNMLVKGVRK